MVELLATFMEMTAPPSVVGTAPPGVVAARERPDIEAYLELYREIGGPVQWDARLRMERAELVRLLAAEGTDIYILRHAGEPVGLCEFQNAGNADVELAYFGLVPSAYGKGYGSYLLNQALTACWRHKPERIWLRTDTNDHPNAIGVYEKAGFRIMKREWQTFPD